MKKKAAAILITAAAALAVSACGNAMNADMDGRIARLEEQIEELKDERKALKEQNKELEERQEELQSRRETSEQRPADSGEDRLLDEAAGIDESNAEDQGVCGENLRWYYAGHTLVIRGAGEMTESGWKEKHREEIERVIIEDGCTAIAYNAFGCAGYYEETEDGEGMWRVEEEPFSNLSEVRLPDTLSSIGEKAFLGCEKLTSVTIPDGVTDIEDFAFSGTGLTGIDLPDGLTYLSGFCNTALTEIDIPDSVEIIGTDAFSYCGSLTGVSVPKHVKRIDDYAFSGCSALSSVTLSESVSKIGRSAFTGAFYDTGITDVTIPNENVIIESGGAFNAGTRLTIGGSEHVWKENDYGWNTYGLSGFE